MFFFFFFSFLVTRLTKRGSVLTKLYIGIFNHQIGFSQAISELYGPISKHDEDGLEIEDPGENPMGRSTCEEYEQVCLNIQEAIQSALEIIENSVAKPLEELAKHLKSIRTIETKREHKRLDLDRFLSTYETLQNKSEKTARDEAALERVEAELEEAQLQYDYYNKMLKDELPLSFQMETEIVRHVFLIFYYTELNVFYTLWNEVKDFKPNGYDWDEDVVIGFRRRKEDVGADQLFDSFNICHFKMTNARSKLEMAKRGKFRQNSAPSLNRYGSNSSNPPDPYEGVGSVGGRSGSSGNIYGTHTPTPYQSSSGSLGGSASSLHKSRSQAFLLQPASHSTQAQASQAGGVALPGVQSLHKSKSQTLLSATMGAEGRPTRNRTASASHAPPVVPRQSKPKPTCTALYEFAPQNPGDLAFKAGEVIEITEGGSNPNAWWTGTVGGRSGTFPGNYVRLN